MKSPTYRLTGGVALLTAALMLGLQPPGTSQPGAPDDTPSDAGSQGPAALEERFGIDFSAARAEALPDTNLTIHRDQLDAWLAARRVNPDLFDGLVIGVVLDKGTRNTAERVAADLAAGRDPATLTDEERAAVGRTGGEAAAALDAAADEEEGRNRPDNAPKADPEGCVDDPTSASASPGEVIVYFACRGDEPSARPESRPVSENLSDAERIEAALEQAASVSEQGRKAGLYTVMNGLDLSRMSVTISNRVAHVDFSDGMLSERFSHSIAMSTVFLEQTVNTVFASSDVEQVTMTVGGDCTAFWEAMGGEGCHHASRADGTNTVRSGR